MKEAKLRRAINTDAIVRQTLADAKREAVEFIQATFDMVAGVCESPIERLLAAELLRPCWGLDIDSPVEFLLPASGRVEHANPPPIDGLFVWPQIRIGAYRVDFLMGLQIGAGYARVVVECGGHDFHERTKAQATRDKRRDRHLTSLGYTVLRFTGSEVYADPGAVVDEVLSVLTSLRGLARAS